MSTVQASDRFTSLPDDQALAATAQPEPGGRPRAGRLRAAQLGRQDPEIHQELPGRIHLVLIRQPVGF